MANALTKAEQNALTVSYDVLGTHIDLDFDFVRSYLVRGKPQLVTPQELMFFMNTCKMQNLNPLVDGEVYLIKYSENNPAQMVIGKDTYLRRAYDNPDFIAKSDGITVQRGKEIIQKEGCCLYPGEVLIGGWCRVYYLRAGKERTAFREVALSEYNQSQANWKSKPATMINKCAISQCVRDAFPREYQGLYSDAEMVASGAVPAEYTDEYRAPQSEAVVAEFDPPATKEQRQVMFRKAQALFKEKANEVVRAVVTEFGFENTSDMKASDIEAAIERLEEWAKDEQTA